MKKPKTFSRSRENFYKLLKLLNPKFAAGRHELPAPAAIGAPLGKSIFSNNRA